MGAVGLQTHIWANNTRSILLLAGFPVLVIFILYGVQLILMGLGFMPGTGRGLGDDMALAASWLAGTIPLAFIVAGIWFAIAYFGSHSVFHVRLPGGTKLMANMINSRRWASEQFTWGDEVWLGWDDQAGVVLTS